MRKNIQLVIIPFSVIVLSTLFYLFFVNSFSGFGTDNQRFIGILDEYETIPEHTILFLGDSQIREDINCNLIDTQNTRCFNFGMAGILPIQLALQQKLITKAEPSIVVFGVSPLLFNEEVNKNDDIFFFMGKQDDLFLDRFILDLLTENEKKLLFMNSVDRALYKRKFVLPFYLSLFKVGKQSLRLTTNNFKDPYIFTDEQTEKQLDEKLRDSEIVSFFEFNRTSERQRESFKHLIRNLQKTDIKIVLVRMPLHPKLITRFSKATKQEYNEFLEDIGSTLDVAVLDAEAVYDSTHFTDLTHVNEKGRTALSKELKGGDFNII